MSRSINREGEGRSYRSREYYDEKDRLDRARKYNEGNRSDRTRQYQRYHDGGNRSDRERTHRSRSSSNREESRDASIIEIGQDVADLLKGSKDFFENLWDNFPRVHVKLDQTKFTVFGDSEEEKADCMMNIYRYLFNEKNHNCVG